MVELLYIGCIGFDYTKYRIKNSQLKKQKSLLGLWRKPYNIDWREESQEDRRLEGYLHSPQKITAGPDLTPILVQIFASLFNLSSLFQGTRFRVKHPCLSSSKVICAKEVRVIATLSYIQPPHSILTSIEPHNYQ